MNKFLKISRKITSLLVVVLLSFVLVGCSNENAGEISFDAEYIQTNSMVDDIEYPVVQKITKKEDLLTYYQDNLDSYNFVNNTDVSVSFATALDKYDEEYFEDSFLVIAVLEEDSSSVYHNIRKVSKRGEIVIERNVNDNTAVSRTHWHVLVEMDNKYQDLDFKVSLEEVSK